MKTLLLTLTLLISSTLYSTEWNDTDKTLYRSYLALQLVDTIQTKNMITCQRNYTCPELAEANPVLGPYPTTSQLLTTKFVSNMVVYTFLDRYSNDRTRRTALYSLILVSTVIVVKNSNNGLSFKVEF